MTELLLAGDVGGTKTVLAIVRGAAGGIESLAEATFENRHFAGLEDVVAAFLGGAALPVERASFSVAGPVVNGEAAMSNRAWTLRSEALAASFGLEDVLLVNDLQATAYAVPRLGAEQILTLQEGVTEDGAIAVLAPGTGLGEAFLTWEGGRLRAHPSEGGHADFAPIGELQTELLRYLAAQRDHVSVEMVCSGIGMPNILAFLRDAGTPGEPDWLAERLATAVDPTPVIVEAALDPTDPCPVCRLTLDTFVDILAAEAGNMAVRLLATGGVYIGGGIPPRIVPILREPRVVEIFRRKGRFSSFLSRVPLHVVLEPRAALLGAAWYGMDAVVADASATPP